MTRGKRLLTRRELAKALTVGPDTISRWAKEKRIPCAVRTGRTMRFDLDEVLEALRTDKSA